MRKLVMNKILTDYKLGLTEIGLEHINYDRAKLGQERIAGISDLEKLSDDELLFVLDQQACDRYR